MWPPPSNSAVKMTPMTRLVAVAIDKDRGSRIALKWASDNVLVRGQTVILVHVRLKQSASGSPLSSPWPNQASDGGDDVIRDDPQMKELFLPFRVFCTRKDIQRHEVVLDNADVTKALIDFVRQNAIDMLVLGATNKGSIFRFKAKDVPGSILKNAPDFCTVYVIHKGKISSTRAATRPPPSSQLRNQILLQASIKYNNTVEQNSLHSTTSSRSHGGARAAEYVKQNLFSNLIRHPKFITDTKLAISDAYSHTDSEFLKSENNQNRDAGSTASTAILVGDRLLVANVGDSRAVICRGGLAFAVSRDHKPDQTDERQRIEQAGGFVMRAGTWRVGGVLAVSRAFGDRLLKQYVVADPDIQEEKVDDTLEFLILASDGLWDVVTNEEAVSMIKPIPDPEDAAKRLMQEANQRGSGDNITIVVVRFLAAKEESSHTAQRD